HLTTTPDAHSVRCLVSSCPSLHAFFFFNDPATTEISTLSLHDALPIYFGPGLPRKKRRRTRIGRERDERHQPGRGFRRQVRIVRSEEHTSELQSLTNLVCRLLLEKKKTHPHHILYAQPTLSHSHHTHYH